MKINIFDKVKINNYIYPISWVDLDDVVYYNTHLEKRFRIEKKKLFWSGMIENERFVFELRKE